MSLIQCKTCGKQVSQNASSCPHCGEPVPKKSPSKGKAILYSLAILYGVTFIMWSTKSGYYAEDHSSQKQDNYTNTKKEDRNTLKGGYFACTTDELFDEITMASVKKDKLAIGHLLSRGCVLTKEGVRFSIIDFGFATTKIRAYDGTDSIILYTNTENIID